MITKTLKIGLFMMAMASFSFVGAQEKLEVKETKKGNHERMFKHLDSNADGSITLEEFKAKRMKDASKEAQLEKRFSKMDTDSNGSISNEEFKVAFNKPRGPKQKVKQSKVHKIKVEKKEKKVIEVKKG